MGFDSRIEIVSRLPEKAVEFLKKHEPFSDDNVDVGDLCSMLEDIVRHQCPSFVIGGLHAEVVIQPTGYFDENFGYGADKINELVTEFRFSKRYVSGDKIRKFYHIPQEYEYWDWLRLKIGDTLVVPHLVFSKNLEGLHHRGRFIVPYPEGYEGEITGVRINDYVAYWSESLFESNEWDPGSVDDDVYREYHHHHRLTEAAEKACGRALDNGDPIVIAEGNQLREIGLMKHLIRPDSLLVYRGGF